MAHPKCTRSVENLVMEQQTCGKGPKLGFEYLPTYKTLHCGHCGRTAGKAFPIWQRSLYARTEVELCQCVHHTYLPHSSIIEKRGNTERSAYCSFCNRGRGKMVVVPNTDLAKASGIDSCRAAMSVSW